MAMRTRLNVTLYVLGLSWLFKNSVIHFYVSEQPCYMCLTSTSRKQIGHFPLSILFLIHLRFQSPANNSNNPLLSFLLQHCAGCFRGNLL